MSLILGVAHIAEGAGILLVVASVLFGAGSESIILGPVSILVKNPMLAKFGLLLLGVGLLVDGAFKLVLLWK